MLDYSQIVDESRKAARRAKRAGSKPVSIRRYTGDVRQFAKLIPFLGDYVPEGWERDRNIAPLFVDASGLGGDDEPALSLSQFQTVLDGYLKSGDNYGFGIAEAGEFQVYIYVYRPDHRDFTHSGNLTADELDSLGSRRK